MKVSLRSRGVIGTHLSAVLIGTLLATIVLWRLIGHVLELRDSGTDKLLRPTWLVDGLGAGVTPRLVGALAHLECEVDSSHDIFSHSVFVGLIKRVWLNPQDAPPLLYHGGAYGQLESATEQSGRFLWDQLE